MSSVTDLVLKPFSNSKYIKPVTMAYKLNGKDCYWDLLEVHDSVAIIIYNITRNVLVLVKQFRPAVYYGHIKPEDRTGKIDLDKYPVSLGTTIELCAGIVDKNLPLAQIAQEEILEECGYQVQIESLKRIASYRSGVGTSGSLQTAYYCEVTDDMKTTAGGGIEDESIEIIEMTTSEIKNHICQSNLNSPSSFLFGIYWFLLNKDKD